MILEENIRLKTQKLLPKEQKMPPITWNINKEVWLWWFLGAIPTQCWNSRLLLQKRHIRRISISKKQMGSSKNKRKSNSLIEICKLQSVDMVIAGAIFDRLHLKWWICFSVTVRRVLAKCTGSSSVLNKNCKFEHRSTDLHTNTLWYLLNHLFAAFNHFNQFFWSSFSNVCLHTLHGSLRFCVCLEISTFGVSACTRPIYTLIFHIWDMPLNV